MENKNIEIIPLESKKYPPRLRQIKCCPKKLYCRGNPEILKNKYILAVVGSRKITSYGKRVLRMLIPEIVKRNIIIVSGLAYGVDILAHELAVDNGGKTVSVLAGGINQIYPPEHTLFASRVIKSGGLLMSENIPGTKYLRQYFPARNRIISGVSDAVLVVEAKQKSGALITSNFAFSQGRKVLAVPGSIFSAQSQGVNGLFNRGAIPVQNPEDILNVLFDCLPAGKAGKRKRKIPRYNTNPCETVNLTPEEKQILELIPFDEPAPVNIIIRDSGLPAARVIAITAQLEIKGTIESEDGGYLKVR